MNNHNTNYKKSKLNVFFKSIIHPFILQNNNNKAKLLRQQQKYNKYFNKTQKGIKTTTRNNLHNACPCFFTHIY